MFKKLLLTTAIAAFTFNGASAELTKMDVEKIVKDYLLENPEIIVESMEALKIKEAVAKQKKSAENIAKNFKELTDTETAGFVGKEDGDITVVEFFDYNCGYCKYVLPEVQKLIDNDKNVKVVFREMPILGKASEQASLAALAVYDMHPDRYFEFHRDLMNFKGRKNNDAVKVVAKQLGLDGDAIVKEAEKSKYTLIANRNKKLARDVGINGTPAFIVGNELIPGAAKYDRISEIIARQRSDKK